MIRYPDVTQKIILRHKDRVLIFKLADGSYDFPGGRVEWMEDLFESLGRELAEELGFKLDTKPELLYTWNLRQPDRDRHSIMIYYLQTLDSADSISSREGHEILWLNKNELKKIIDDAGFVDKIFDYQENTA
jgi:ADP-ribose pyrophosphatase YjhB (NUDIX family)